MTSKVQLCFRMRNEISEAFRHELGVSVRLSKRCLILGIILISANALVWLTIEDVGNIRPTSSVTIGLRGTLSELTPAPETEVPLRGTLN